ncbi:putative Cop9 signalosome complex subunit [Trypoxylus dichotomus]
MMIKSRINIWFVVAFFIYAWKLLYYRLETSFSADDKSIHQNSNNWKYIMEPILPSTFRLIHIVDTSETCHNQVDLRILNLNEIYRYDKQQQQDILTAKPWEKDPHFFKDIKISALALLKMVMHARSGGNLEVMGLILGKIDGNTMFVMDSFALPVEGTETRVNAQAQAYEYMSSYMDAAKMVGREENAIGWYHSHPGYGCWLSGIDVTTQMTNQSYQEPFVAIVIDPVRTISSGKVCLGAFRTYPKGYKPANEEPSEYQTIPLNKIEDFGVHCKQYYSLEVSYFKSTLDRRLLDSLWNKYWVNTLSSSSLLTNADYTTGQMVDLSEKLEQSEAALGRGGFMVGGTDPHEKRTEDKLMKATKDSCKTTIEIIHGLMAQMIKDRLFNDFHPNNVQLHTPSCGRYIIPRSDMNRYKLAPQ